MVFRNFLEIWLTGNGWYVNYRVFLCVLLFRKLLKLFLSSICYPAIRQLPIRKSYPMSKQCFYATIRVKPARFMVCYRFIDKTSAMALFGHIPFPWTITKLPISIPYDQWPLLLPSCFTFWHVLTVDSQNFWKARERICRAHFSNNFRPHLPRNSEHAFHRPSL